MRYIFYNQKLIPEKQGQISIEERGFMFGDGVFETCKISGGKIYNFLAHKSRLAGGLKALMINAQIDDLEERSLKLIKKNQIIEGHLRIYISRGIGSMGYLPANNIKSLTIIQTLESRKIPQEIVLGISHIKKPAKETVFISHKSANSLPYILTKIAAEKKNHFDDILLDENSNILETSSSNIFWVKNNEIFTPSLSCNILAGTMRSKVIELLCGSKYKVIEVEEKIDILKSADEVFITNSSIQVGLVSKIFFSKNEYLSYANVLSKEVLHLVQNDIDSYAKI